ncbi:MAG: TerD family protein [Synergistaceae bacterium]|nr:TerD family protein [Synergistaceae bacterium]
MAVNLQKGQRVDLKKSDGDALSRVMIGLGWDEAEQSDIAPAKGGFLSGLFGGGSSSKRVHNIDCDASVFVCRDGRLRSSDDVVYFGNLEHPSGAIKHMGDNLTGEGEGDDEQIFIDLMKLPRECDKIVFVVNVYKAHERNQHFGMIKNAFIRICDDSTGQEIFRYDLSENYNGMTAMIFGEIYRRNDQWRFNAIGQATTDESITELAERFRH